MTAFHSPEAVKGAGGFGSMLILRLARVGTKKRPVYHLVATDSRNRRDGNFIEKLGYFIPATDTLVVDQMRIDHWLSVGAQTSETVGMLIKKSRKGAAAAVTA